MTTSIVVVIGFAYVFWLVILYVLINMGRAIRNLTQASRNHSQTIESMLAQNHPNLLIHCPACGLDGCAYADISAVPADGKLSLPCPNCGVEAVVTRLGEIDK